MPFTLTPEQWEAVRRATALSDEGVDLKVEAGGLRRLVEEIEAQQTRRLQLAEEVMKLQADLSTARTEAAQQRAAVEQFYRDAEGHNFCWQNARRLFEAFGWTAPETPPLPPLDERMHGCRRFWTALEILPERWPDFTSSNVAEPNFEHLFEAYLVKRGWLRNAIAPETWQWSKEQTMSYSLPNAVHIQMLRDVLKDTQT